MKDDLWGSATRQAGARRAVQAGQAAYVTPCSADVCTPL